jgi:hypothetical protein
VKRREFTLDVSRWHEENQSAEKAREKVENMEGSDIKDKNEE